MRVGIFSDAHDHVDNVRRAVTQFNLNHCEFVLFAGDFCSPLVVPPLKKLACKMFSCFGDNDGNRRGITGGMRIIGEIASGPVCIQVEDGTRFLLTHMLNDVRDDLGDPNVIVFAHTHRPSVVKDEKGRLFVNPGETSGWSFRKPSIAIVETETLEATIIHLPEMPPIQDA